MHNRTVLALQTNESLWRSVRQNDKRTAQAAVDLRRYGRCANEPRLMPTATGER